MTTQLSENLEQKKSKWVHFAIIGFMAILTLCLFHEAFNPNKMLVSQDQITTIGTKAAQAQSWREHGQFALWNKGIFSGMSSSDAISGDFLYPIGILFDLLMPIYQSSALKLILHIFFAGLFFYLMLLKGFGLPPLISGIAAVFYMLNPQFFSHIYPGHEGKMYVIAWLPYMVWRLKAGLEKPNLQNTALLALGLALGLLSPHVQMMFFVYIGLGAVWLFWTILKLIETKDIKTVTKQLLFFWGAVFAGLSIAALQFYPAFQYVQDAHSVRGVDRGFEFATSWSMHFAEIMSLWIPEYGNTLQYYWGENYFKLNSEYIGAVATLLAILAVVLKPNAWRIFWAVFSVFILLFSLGADSPGIRFGENPEDVLSIYTLFYWFVPGINKFRAISMISFWISFAIILLSALSLKDIWNEEWKKWSEKRLKNTKTGILIGIGILTLISLVFANKGFNFDLSNAFTPNFESKQHVWEANFEKNFLPALLGWWIIATIILASIWAVLSGYLKKEIAIVMFLILGMIDTIRIDTQFIEFQSNSQFKKIPNAVSEVLRKTKDEPARTMFYNVGLSPTMEAYYGLESVSGYHDNEFRWYREFRGNGGMNYFYGLRTLDQIQGGTNTLNIANCKYIFYATPAGQLAYIENKNVLPRISFTNNYEVIENRNKISEILLSPDFNARQTVVLEQKPNFASVGEENAITQISTKWTKYTTNLREAEIEVPTNGLLRLSEVYYVGWSIYLDGKKQEVLNSDLAFMAIEVPAGKHTVTMKIGSPYMKTALLLSIPGFILLFVVFGQKIFGKIITKKKES